MDLKAAFGFRVVGSISQKDKFMEQAPCTIDPKMMENFCSLLTPEAKPVADDLKSKLLTNKQFGQSRGLLKQLDLSKLSNDEITLPSFMPAPQNLLAEFSPFVIAFRKHTVRFGPLAWPMNGVGALAIGLEETVCLVLVPMKNLLDNCQLKHLDDFEDRLESKAFAKHSEYSFLQLAPGSACWVPYGWVALPSTAAAVGSILIIPWLAKQLKDATDPDVWALVSGQLQATVRKNENKMPWKRVGQPFTQFCNA